MKTAHLVGGFNPSEKYDRQIGSFPQIGMNIKQCLKPPPSYVHTDLLGFVCFGCLDTKKIPKWRFFLLIHHGSK